VGVASAVDLPDPVDIAHRLHAAALDLGALVGRLAPSTRTLIPLIRPNPSRPFSPP